MKKMRRIWRASVDEIRSSPTALMREVRVFEHDREIMKSFWSMQGPADILPTTLQRHDLAVAALVFKAMNQKADLHVQGPVSRVLLENIQEFMEIWSLWRPDLYAPVSITADEEVRGRRIDPARGGAAVCAFSGGVDASATLWRHHAGLADRMTRKIRAAVLIQGFDIPLDSKDAFDRTSRTTAETLRDVDIPLVLVSTNWLSEVCVAWEMEFALGIAACLRQWDDDVDTLLLGSCEDFSRLVIPWGSHPLPTRLLAGEDSAIVYDGGHLTRTQKVALLNEWPLGYNSLRVCWQGEVTGNNCGVCEKCIRTKLNSIVSGLPIPKSLGGRPTLLELEKIGPFKQAQRNFMTEILDEAKRNNIYDPLLDGVIKALARSDRDNGLKTMRHRAKAAFSKKIGISKRFFQRLCFGTPITKRSVLGETDN